jgi:pyrroloquinoline quinone biosynthesis protein D
MVQVRRPIKLAPGIQLSRDSDTSAVMLLVLTAGKVHLNGHALAILELCDGSRSRDRVVVDAMLRLPGGMRADDVVEFLEAAQSRGWLVEDE